MHSFEEEMSDDSRLLFERPGYLIRRLSQFAAALYTEHVGPETTPLQHGALVVISARPGIDQLRLGRAMNYDRTTIAGVVRRLESKGLIVRQRDPDDRRANLLFITEAGTQKLAELAPLVERVRRRTFAALTEDEKQTLITLLQKLVDDLDHPTQTVAGARPVELAGDGGRAQVPFNE